MPDPFGFHPATPDLLRDIGRRWPLGLAVVPDGHGPHGLVFQRGDREQFGVKLQPADVPESDAVALHHVNRALIAASLPYYLEKGHHGVLVPCAYHRAKAPGWFETGIALFTGPDAASRSRSQDRSDIMYDSRLGEGSTAMIFDMAAALAKASQATGLPIQPIIGMDLAPRLALGGLALHFVVAGGQVCVVKHPLDEAEPVWRFLMEAGLGALPYAPMIPAALPAND